MIVRQIATGMGLAVLAFVATTAAAHAATEHTLARPEGQRHYIVVDGNGSHSARRPAGILLHGHGVSAAQMVGSAPIAGYTERDWTALAERENFLLIAPDGMQGSDGKRGWNDCRADAVTNPASDDTGFIGALIDTAIAQLGADPERIYVFGSSNGGGMAYRLAIELGPRLAAIGTQSAPIPAQSSCKAPSHPLPVFMAHGTADRIVPYAGGRVAHGPGQIRGKVIAAEDAASMWRALAGLHGAAVEYRFPHLHPDDTTSATRYVWGAGPAGMQLEFLRIDGGGHTASSIDGKLPWLLGKLIGPMNHDVNMAEEAWTFFEDKRSAGSR